MFTFRIQKGEFCDRQRQCFSITCAGLRKYYHFRKVVGTNDKLALFLLGSEFFNESGEGSWTVDIQRRPQLNQLIYSYYNGRTYSGFVIEWNAVGGL